jgi:hypothetical protein
MCWLCDSWIRGTYRFPALKLMRVESSYDRFYLPISGELWQSLAALTESNTGSIF